MWDERPGPRWGQHLGSDRPPVHLCRQLPRAPVSAFRRLDRVRRPLPGREPRGDLLLRRDERVGRRQRCGAHARPECGRTRGLRAPLLRVWAVAVAGVAVKYARLLCRRGGTRWSTIGRWASPSSRCPKSDLASGLSPPAGGARSRTIKRSTCYTKPTTRGLTTSMSPRRTETVRESV